MSPETCAECGFDSRAWKVRDAASLLGALGMWWRLATDGITGVDLNTRPSPGVWSALEYGVHSALVVAVLREAIGRILSADGVALPSAPPASDAAADDSPIELDRNQIVGDIDREGRALAGLTGGAKPEVWAHVGHPPGETVRADALLVHAVHDATHHQMDVGRGLAAIGAGTPAHAGRVDRINASDGGVPKREIASGAIHFDGLAGDRQAERAHHGRPFQALCLWSAEVIGELAAQGHPIGPGCAGENLTIAGLDWSALRPGSRLKVGTALVEVSLPATPCVKQARWFADRDFARIAYERNPQWVRWYAWVRAPGEVRPDDAAIVQPT
jgi:MOSC domain-containing protein YiiM